MGVEGKGGYGRRNGVVISEVSKWLLCQSIKYEGETKLDGPLCSRLTSLDFTLQHLF